MARNVEIKARAAALDDLERRARRLQGPGDAAADAVLRQTDTYFDVGPDQRLKLRQFDDGTAELIRYTRPDISGPKTSTYTVEPQPDPEATLRALSDRHGVRVTVRKVRRLRMVGQTRVHLDEVAELGAFVELEVVLREGQTTAEGQRIAADLMESLGIATDDLIDRSYVDLLEQRRASPR